MQLYGMESWSSILTSQRALKRLDQTLSLGAKMALGLDIFPSTYAALSLVNVTPARLQILRRLNRFMVRNTICDVFYVAKLEPFHLCVLLGK